MWAQCNHKRSYKGKREAGEIQSERQETEGGVMCFEDEGKNYKPRNPGDREKIKKSRKQILS